MGLASLDIGTSVSAADKSVKPAATIKSRTVTGKTAPVRTATVRTALKIVRAQDNPFEEEFQEEPDVRGRARVIQASATEPAVEEQPTEQTPAAPQEERVGTESDALKKLKDRSAKERWEQLHEEWLKTRKERAKRPLPPLPRAPAPTPAKTPEAADPFAPEAELPSQIPELPAGASESSVTLPDPQATPVDVEPDDFPSERPIRAPRLEPGKVQLQSQPKARPGVPPDSELTKLYQGDDATRMAPPIRDPKELPKISEIQPVPKPRISAPGRQIPEDDAKRYVKLGHTPYIPRQSPEFFYAWEATKFNHQPLYFEDAALERYGHTLPGPLQPIVSVGKFSAQLAFLPYQMAIKSPVARVSPLGWYGPGDYSSYRMYQVPWNAEAAAIQAATVLGVGYVTP